MISMRALLTTAGIDFKRGLIIAKACHLAQIVGQEPVQSTSLLALGNMTEFMAQQPAQAGMCPADEDAVTQGQSDCLWTKEPDFHCCRYQF